MLARRGVHRTSQHAHNALKSASKFMRTPFQGRTPRTEAPTRFATGAPPTTAPPTPRVVDFDSSVDGLPSPFAPATLTPLHLRTPPPEPWMVQPKRRVSTFEETMVKSLLQQGGRGRKGRGATSQGGGTSSVTPLGGDDEFEAFEGVQQQQVSPMVKSGFLINPLSGRPIKIGGDTYNRLLEEGYRPDVGAGVLLLPLAEEEEGAGQVSGGRSGPRLRASSNSQRQQQAGGDSTEPEASFGSSKRPPRFQW
ncbi:hypothetical protein DUNSADRAFT_3896 [Dunaliella salina]|uniref:2-cysteine adaptor domain-containing protein n=1 Tax=Dunaliella salina TaxID=3046 RepID=A0ABQ7GT27_DUNSA|nr:hypothetical protein DUNSADRAFT_3896 [Dunaliella salina]|eukprot:KAF5837753.1 hypothetical protein DUNSADRAFT_3896 [Dunaliella salina]